MEGKTCIYKKKELNKKLKEAREVILADLKDPAEDINRVQKDEWLIVVGVCTHLGCVPLGQKMTDTKGDYNGWYCPCHGSHYDTSGESKTGTCSK